jgi:hypothetical protein
MLGLPTVFVLGAGAGVDVGMPVGEKLTGEIAKKVDITFERGKKTGGDDITTEALRLIAKAAGADANSYYGAGRNIAKGVHYSRSIDSYIHRHSDNERVKVCGKVAIVQTILEYERKSALFVDTTTAKRVWKRETEVRSSWFSDLMYVLQDRVIRADNLDAIFNDLVIINFNYDRCVEHFLLHALQHMFHVSDVKAKELMTSLKIFHPYGKVAPLPWEEVGGLAFGGDPHGEEPNLPELYNNIRTFNEEVEEGAELQELRKLLTAGRRVIFLGFHFHQQNMDLIRLAEKPEMRGSERALYATVLGREAPEVKIIREQIEKQFHPALVETLGHDCKSFFRMYATTLMR